jgi:prolyl oligopeptidase
MPFFRNLIGVAAFWLIITALFIVRGADHDDRVWPGHSFKFAAALQEAQSGRAPILIRIETKAGHGAGKPTSKIIEELADRWAFLLRVLGENAS